MATYRFRITFEDYDDVTRDIEIRSTQTFEDFHHAIHSSIGFDASKPASFFLSDDNWKKGKEFTTRDVTGDDGEKINTVKKSRLCDYIADPHQKIYYIFDPSSPWTFRIELVKISKDEENGINYPRCVKSTGDAPKQYQAVNIATLPVPEDFDLIGEEDDDIEEGTDETELAVEESDLPEGEEKESFTSNVDDDAPVDDFETADEDAFDEEPEKDDF